MARPQTGDFKPYAQAYINLAEGDAIPSLITNHADSLLHFLQALPEEKADYSYAEGKWTVKQLLQHVIDTERIFVYRAVSIARGETAALPNFDENVYANNATASHRSLQSLQQEFALVRQSTDFFLLSLTEASLQNKGVASNHPVTVNALAFMIFGHAIHHKNILQQRYL